MKTRFTSALPLMTLTSLGLLPSAQAADPQDNLNRFSLGPRIGMNVSANFYGLAQFIPTSAPGAADASLVNRSYDDGYVRVDSSGNLGGQTWNWGYNTAAQTPGNDTLLLHSYAPGNSVSSQADDAPYVGLEASYGRILYSRGSFRLGLEGAFNWLPCKISDSSSLPANLVRTTDTYGLYGSTPPLPPYNGTYEGPGMLLDELPASRSIEAVTGSGTLSGNRRLDVDLYGFRFGPFLEIEILPRLTFTAQGGVAWACADSTFSYNDTVVVGSQGLGSSSGEIRNSSWLLGGYVGGQFGYRFAKAFHINAGAQYQSLKNYSTSVNGRDAELRLRDSVFVNCSVQYDF